MLPHRGRLLDRAPTCGCWPPTSASALGGGAHLRNLRRTAGSGPSARRRWPAARRARARRTCSRPAQALRDLPQVERGRRDGRARSSHGSPLDRVSLGAAGDGPWAVARRGRGAAGRLRGDRDRPHGGPVRAGRQRLGRAARVTSSPWRSSTAPTCAPPAGGSAVTIGAYDGVHLGHRYSCASSARQAAARGLASAVVTFDRHPATVVRPDSAPPLLTDLDQKLELLAAARHRPHPGGALRPGPGRRDGRGLRRRGARRRPRGPPGGGGRGLPLRPRPRGQRGAAHRAWARGTASRSSGVALEDRRREHVVSSTRIRELLAAGDVVGPPRSWGAPTRCAASVVHGDGRGGAELGLPDGQRGRPRRMALPGEGIYACWYERPDGSVHPAAVSFGRRPDLPRPRRAPAARGLPARLRRRPLRRAGPGVLRERLRARSGASTPSRPSSPR